MTKIKLEFECTAPNGVCFFSLSRNVCIEDIEEHESGVCTYLMATRKKEKASQKHGGE